MKKVLALSALLTLTLIGLAIPARAQTVPDVRGIQPFSAESNYMSLEGYLRWQYFQNNQAWVTASQARQMVIAQVGSTTVIASGGIVRRTQ
ncbi:MAG: hypothetical protein ACYC7E_10360 [Armatimonadota bacterium]